MLKCFFLKILILFTESLPYSRSIFFAFASKIEQIQLSPQRILKYIARNQYDRACIFVSDSPHVVDVK